MSKSEGSPTMIIPAGTEISIDAHGQLSVRTPGNLVIQNSGHYGEIESLHGSIRIEANAEVEAVSVRCAETCYVQGSLTAWRVKAKNINLEEKAQARVVLQESETIEIGKNAKLVGNFSSEKELFLLFSRFAPQLRSLPFYFDRNTPHLEFDPQAEAPAAIEAGRTPPAARPQGVPHGAPPQGAHPQGVHASGGQQGNPFGGSPAGQPMGPQGGPLSNRVLESVKELPDPLFFALVLLERESKNEAHGPSVRVIDELVKLLKTRDLETLKHTHRTLFSRVTELNDDIRRAHELLARFFGNVPTEAAAAV